MKKNSLEEFIAINSLTAKILKTNLSTNTVEESALAFNCKINEIIKSIVMKATIGENFSFHIVIVQGDRRIKISKLKRLLHASDVVLASPEEVLEKTGYNIGDVPPISIDLPTIIDTRIESMEKLYAGGGKANSNLLIVVSELINTTNARITDISAKKK